MKIRQIVEILLIADISTTETDNMIHKAVV